MSESESSGGSSDHDSDEQIAAENPDFKQDIAKEFGQRGINNEAAIEERLASLKSNFYNRLSSNKLIKKEGRVPFIEHLTISNNPN